MSLARKTAWSAAAALTSSLGRLASGIILARLLGPHDFGAVAYLVWLVEISGVVTGFGLQNSLTRFVAEMEGQGQSTAAAGLARWVVLRYLGFSALGALGLVALASTSSVGAKLQGHLLPLAILLPLQGLATLNGADLAGRQRFDLLARLTFFSSLVLVVGQTAGARFFGVPGALMGTAAGALLPALYGLGLLRGSSRTGPVPAALGSRVWRYAANTWLAAMVSAIIWSRAEIFFLERYRGSGEVSSFAVGVALSSLASQGPLLLMGAFLPHFSQLRGAGERPAIAAAYASGTRLVALLLFPLSFGIAAVVPVLLPLVYGAGYSAAVPVATALLMLASLGFANIGSSLMYAYERSRFIAMAGVVGAVVSVGAWLLLVPAFGAEGAVLVRAALQVSMIALATWYIVRVLGFPFPMASLGRTLLAAMASALTMRLTITFSQTALGLLAAGTLGLASYLLAARWLRVVEEEDARRIQAMTGRLPGLLARPLGHVIAWLSPGA